MCHLIDENIDTGPTIHHRTTVIPKTLNTPEEIDSYQDEQLLVFYKELISKLSLGKSFDLVQQTKYFGNYNDHI